MRGTSRDREEVRKFALAAAELLRVRNDQIEHLGKKGAVAFHWRKLEIAHVAIDFAGREIPVPNHNCCEGVECVSNPRTHGRNAV
jgi:hypothetical protein